MKIYVPAFDRNWFVQEIDTDKIIAGMKQFRVSPHTPGYTINIDYCGTIYNGDHCFPTEEDAWKWIRKDYSCLKNNIDPRTIGE